MLFMIENQEDLLKTERLYEKYKNTMFYVANSILKDNALSEDAVHSSFVRILDNLYKIDESNHIKTKSFLCIICRNVSLDIYNSRINTTELVDDMDLKDTNFEPSQVIINEEYLNEVSETIALLKPIYQDVIFLKFFHDYSTSEISEFLHISNEVVKKRIQRSKTALYKIFEKNKFIF